MISVKNRVFNNFTKAQKSELCHYLSKFVKKNFGKTSDEIKDLYLEEELYYIEIKNSRHPWIEEHLDELEFSKDLLLFISDQIKKYEHKEKQKPYLEKQKQLQKEQRKKAQEFKMSKEPPTKAQISYYKSLCKKYKLDNTLEFESSKLDYKIAISEILDNYSDKNQVVKKLEELK